MGNQPAKVSYFFEKGYNDLQNTIIDAFIYNIASNKKYFAKVKEYGVISFKGVFWIVAALSVLVAGGIVFLIGSLLQVTVLIVVFLTIYLLFTFVWLVDRAYIIKNKISSACSNPLCQEKFLIPTYVCECGANHSKLVPSKYGILKRTCECGNRLPTTFLNGREKINAICPFCENEIKTGGKAVQHSIPVVGGPSVGKTCYVNMAVKSIMEDVAIRRGWETSYNTIEDEKNHTRALEALSNGVKLEKTEFANLTAYKFLVRTSKGKINRQIYVYDISGEMFSSSNTIQNNKAYTYSNGFIFMIDPLSLRDFAIEKVDLNLESYGVSSTDFEDILNIMLVNLDSMFGLKQNDILKLNLAIVINKCDIPGLEKLVGDGIANKYMSSNEKCKDFSEAKNHVCKTFLETYGAGNFVRIAESKFNNVRYFTCSALGHNKNGVSFKSADVEKPLLWLIESKDIELREV